MSNSARPSLTWEEMVVGSEFTTMRRTITEPDLVSFVQAAGLFEILFLDVPYVIEESPFRGRLVPAALTYSFAEGLAVQASGIHNSGMAFLGMTLNVKKPVLVGDTIQVSVTILESRPSKQGNQRGIVTARNSVVNQNAEEVLEYFPVRLVKGRNI